ncbi:hypothetical protein GCM10023213_43330 [Prosthecobacter algae]|uniref:Terminase small subunit n=1 Tax=Prosthecobacter algae TaxID=1144682 RepID=A0ABP9PK75_9BACT
MKTRLTPQQKKLYSYAKDGRNGRAESRSVANKAISKHKAKANRAFRRAQVQALTKDDETVPRVDRKSFKKSPDVPLAVYVQIRLSQRAKIKDETLLKAGPKAAKMREFVMDGHLRADRDLGGA